MKNSKLVNASFMALLGIVFLLIGIFATTAPDAVVMRWILISLGILLLGGGIFFVVRWYLFYRECQR